jgi:hypothetical protein
MKASSSAVLASCPAAHKQAAIGTIYTPRTCTPTNRLNGHNNFLIGASSVSGKVRGA